jgi:Flp pilus assembly protein TadD
MRAFPWWSVAGACVLAAIVERAIVRNIWADPIPTTVEALTAELPRDSLDVAHHPTSFRAHRRLADVLLHLGHPREAEASARRAVQLAPRQASAHATLGAVLITEGQWAPGLAELIIARDGGARDRMTLTWLAWAYDMARQNDAAARAYAYALDRYPADPVLVNAYTLFAIRTGRPQALDYAQRVVALAPSWAPAHATLAMAYAGRNDAHHAREHMQRATELVPSLWWYWANLGSYAFLDGDTTAAWAAFSRARGLDSAHVDATPSWRAMWATANAAHH